MKEGRPSRTAEWVAFLRGLATLEAHPIAPDPVAARLVGRPFRDVLALLDGRPRAAAAIHKVADKLSAGRGRHMALRTRAIDDEVQAAIKAGARQLVLLGAGLDARAYRLDALAESVVFEIDHPATQAYKRAQIAGLHPKARDLRHVEVNFEKDDWFQKLTAAGFDPKTKAIFVWEGVTMYLTREAIDATLESVRRAAPGSRLAMTYKTPKTSPDAANRIMPHLVKAAGEPFRTSLGPDDARRLLEAHGFRMLEDSGDVEWNARYLGTVVDDSLERLAVAERI
jgi:methyltransferase (TIGR00027 family)